MTNPRSRPQRVIAFVLLAMLAVAGAGAAASPGKVDVDLLVRTPLGDVDPEPIPVQNPVLPNLVPEVVDRVAPFLKPTGTDVGNTERGPYVDHPLTPPVVTDIWGRLPGVGPRHFEPLATLLHLLNAADDTIPVDLVDIDAAITDLPRAVTSEFGVAPPLSGAEGGIPALASDFGKPTVPAFTEAATPLPVYDALVRQGTPFVVPVQGHGPDASVSEASANSMPSLLHSDATIAFVLAAGLGLLALKLLVPLYHRFKRKTALDNPTRSKLYELLRDAPGLSAAELSERSSLHVTTVKYHMDVLRKVGMVGEQSVDGTRRFYSYENGDRMEFLSRALLDEPTARRIYAQIETAPGRPFIEVARSLGMRKEHVHYHVKKLAKHGLIADRWLNGRRLLYPAGHAEVAGKAAADTASTAAPEVPA